MLIQKHDKNTGKITRSSYQSVESMLRDCLGEDLKHVILSGKERTLASRYGDIEISFPHDDFFEYSSEIAEMTGKFIIENPLFDYVDNEIDALEGAETMLMEKLEGIGITKNQMIAIKLLVPTHDFLEINDARYANMGVISKPSVKHEYVEKMKLDSSKNDTTNSSVMLSMMGIEEKESRFIPTGTIMRKNVDFLSMGDHMILIDREKTFENLDSIRKRPASRNTVVVIQDSIKIEPEGVVGYSDCISNPPVVYSTSFENAMSTKQNIISNEAKKQEYGEVDFGVQLYGDNTNTRSNAFCTGFAPIYAGVVPNLAIMDKLFQKEMLFLKHKETHDDVNAIVLDSKVCDKLGVPKTSNEIFLTVGNGEEVQRFERGQVVNLNPHKRVIETVILNDYEVQKERANKIDLDFDCPF